MKKFFILILILTFLVAFSSCASKEMKIGDLYNEIIKEHNVIYHRGTITTIFEDSSYTVLISCYDKIEKIVVFSSNRICKNSKNIALITNLPDSSVIGMSTTQVVEQYGEFHGLAGSGSYLPAYITVDGYLLYFYVETGGKITGMYKQDLIANPVLSSVKIA